MNCFVDFNQERTRPSGEITAYPLILANGKEIGEFRQYHKSGNWGAVMNHQPGGVTTGKNVPGKLEALRLLSRRLERQGRTLIDAPEGTSPGGQEYPPAEVKPKTATQSVAIVETSPGKYQAVITNDYGDYERSTNFRVPRDNYDAAWHDAGWLLLENKGSIDKTHDPRVAELVGLRIAKKKGLCRAVLIRRDKRPVNLGPWEDVNFAEALGRRMLNQNKSLIDMDNIRNGW